MANSMPYHPDIVALHERTEPRPTRRRRRKDEAECPILDPLRHLAYNHAPIAHEETKRRKLEESGPRDITGKTEKQLKNIESSEIGRESTAAYQSLLEKQLGYVKAKSYGLQEEVENKKEEIKKMKQALAQIQMENAAVCSQRLQAYTAVVPYSAPNVLHPQLLTSHPLTSHWTPLVNDTELNTDMNTESNYDYIARMREEMSIQENKGMGALSYASVVSGHRATGLDEPGYMRVAPSTWQADSSQDLTDEIRMVSLQGGLEGVARNHNPSESVNESRSFCSDLTALSNLRRV